APEAGAAAGGNMAQYVDEQVGLAVFGGGRTPPQRKPDIAADVGDHAPEQAMADVVEPGQPEQLLRFQQVDAENALGQEGDRQPSGLGEGGQQQRVEPDQEAGAKPQQRPQPR